MVQVNENLRIDTYEIEGIPELHMVFDYNIGTVEYLTSSITVTGSVDLTTIRDTINTILGE